MAAQRISNGLDLGTLLGGGAQLLSLFGDKTTTTSGGTTTGTRTSGLDITDEGRNKMIRDILESSQGLANIASGARGSGLYNSSTNQLLVNDLIDRVSSSVDRDTAKTVETSTQTTSGGKQVQEAPFGLGTAALGLGAAVGAKKLYDIISGSGAVADAGGAAASVLGSALPDFGLGSISGGLDFGGFGLGGATKLLEGDVGGFLGNGLSMLAGNAILPGVGGPIASIISNVLPVNDIVSGIGDFASSLVGSVVCTQLFVQGKLPAALYYADIEYARKHMSATTLDGYRLWGVPLVRLMRRNKFVAEAARLIVVQRAHYTASRMGYSWASRPRAVVGGLINALGVPVCYALGRLLQLRRRAVATNSLYTVVPRNMTGA